MCVLIFYMNPGERSPSGYKLILLSIRDELFTRPTAHAQFWQKNQDVIGGMDLEPGREGGTWLAFHRNGRFASLLNVLQKTNDVQANKRGRGFLVVDFLKGTVKPSRYVQSLYESREEFNGFTIVCVDLKEGRGAFMCNKSQLGVQLIEKGYYAFGNSILPRNWPKVDAGKRLFQEAVEKNIKSERELEESLFEIMNDSTCYGNDEFMRRQTDEPEEILNLRSCLKFYIPKYDYGSRTHTVVLIRGDNSVLYVEKTVEDGKWVERKTEFKVDV
ncbi:transport and Golgi organization protein 2 homolog isoform X2 [Varroa jacobsoni]|uniref:Transport and Golgi organization protein 2 homolog n=1 Tax=Varroa destructor TaxID=109461 RepID=A0A7M7KST3_VARDE|nr:transport and Golgi organization protein 2 homolog isoform X2 [Varroa destructor]XP_022710203.1 transport and Golgi organization protein 2 homolog isoform X2 [Varroa jacobsoni]